MSICIYIKISNEIIHGSVCPGSFSLCGYLGKARTSALPKLTPAFISFSDDDLLPYDMSEDKELKVKAPVYIRDCIEGRRFWAESSSVSC